MPHATCPRQATYLILIKKGHPAGHARATLSNRHGFWGSSCRSCRAEQDRRHVFMTGHTGSKYKCLSEAS